MFNFGEKMLKIRCVLKTGSIHWNIGLRIKR
jgi:hypothetical protein